MRKKLLIVLGIVVLLFLVALISVPLWIDGAAKAAIEAGGTKALGVKTTLDEIRIGIFGGTCELSGLTIMNPEGFEKEHFMKLGSGSIGVRLKTVLEDTIVAPELRIEDVDVNLERIAAKTNYGTIIDNIGKRSGPEEEEPAEGGKKFVIERIVVRNVKVDYKVSLVGAVKPGVPLVINEIVIENAGSEGSGISMPKLISILIRGILDSVASAGKGVLPDEITDTLGKGIEGIAEGGKKLVEGIGGIFGGKDK